MKKVFKFLCFLVLTLFIAGCAKDLVISNTPNSNLNYHGDNVPVTVIAYKLRDVAKFKDASIVDLAERNGDVLGQDKIDSIKTQIQPNTNRYAFTNVDPDEVPYVGILVLYADQSKTNVKAFKATREAKEKNIVFEITKNGVNTLDASSSKVTISH